MMTPDKHSPASSRQQRGAGLIEVLIAVLVLAVGLLGFAGLQTQAVRMNYDSLQRARASILAEELFDRMRANRVQAIDSATSYTIGFEDAIPPITTDCSTDVCTPAEMATWDMNQWLTRLQARIPGATADVTKPNSTSEPNRYLVTISLVEQTEGELALQVLDESASDFDDQLQTLQSVNFQFETWI